MPIEKEKKNTNKGTNVYFKFIIIYFLFMSARAIFNPFITVYLQEKGFEAELIGLIMGANSLVIILAQPFWGIISDKLRSVKKTLIICIFLQAAFSLALVYCNTFLTIAACFCTYSFFSSPEGPLLDTWCLKSLNETGYKNSVGQMKFLGCFGYAAFSIMSGYVINKYNTETILPVFAVVLVFIGMYLLQVKTKVQTQRSVSLKELHLEKILKDKRFLIFLVFVFLMQLPHRAAYTFYPLLISSLGGNKMMVGYTSAIMFLSEGICMVVSRKIFNRFRAKNVIMISAGFFLIWQLFYSIVEVPWHIAAIALFDGPSYGFFTIGVLYYLDEFAPQSVRTTYQTIGYAVYFGLSGIVGNSIGGWIIASYGFQTMYLCGAALIMISIIFFYISNNRLNKKENEHEKICYGYRR